MDRDSRTASPKIRVSKPGTAEPTDRPRRPPLRVVVAALRDAGASSVGQAEPSHGSEFQILSGVFERTLIVAAAGRVGSGLFSGLREVGRRERDGIVVRLMRSDTGLHTGFRRNGVVWLFGVLDEAARQPVRLLVNLASAVAGAC